MFNPLLPQESDREPWQNARPVVFPCIAVCGAENMMLRVTELRPSGQPACRV
jgi:hypothetical protein